MVVYKQRDTPRAQALRREASPAERHLWRRLSNRQLESCKFSRQMPIGPYFADLLCRERMLVVEVDGHSHDLRIDHDEQRDRFMMGAGYRILRFSNADVMARLEGVLLTIAEALNARPDAHPQPLPHAGGEK
jgi:very-short-patch-repair endonuclease